MKAETRVILEHLLIALAAGGLIGFERSTVGPRASALTRWSALLPAH